MPTPGSDFAGFRIHREIGRGGMGVVYEAEQLGRLKRRVALKVIAAELSGDATFRRRFEREAQHAASLDHPNVVPVFEAGEVDGCLFVAMRYVDGLDAAALVLERKHLTEAEAGALIAQTAAALDAAHANGLVHRDVKPANILCVGGDPTAHVYLTDFGLTKEGASASSLTNTGHWVGTVDYVAPEQIKRGRVDARTDVYGLACVLFHMLSGHPPFQGTDVQKMWAQMNEPPPSLREVSPSLAAGFDPVIARGMAKEPDDRYPSAGDLGRAAAAASRGSVNTVPEQTVATGIAATGISADSGTDATAAIDGLGDAGDLTTPPEQAQPARRGPERRTLVQSQPVAQHSNGPRRGNRNSLIAAGVVLLVLAGAGVAFGISKLGGDDNPSRNATAGAGRETTTVTTTTTSSTTPETTVGSADGLEPSTFELYRPSEPEFDYVAELPSGNGWAAPVESHPSSGALLRTTSRGPAGTFVLIERTPDEEPQLGGDFDSSRSISQPAFGTATEYAISESTTFPECDGFRCIDIQFPDGLGGGWGILAGGPSRKSAEGLARHVSDSISLGD